MGVTCPACGGMSRDLEFCDHCNADLLPPAAQVSPAWCPLFPDEAMPLAREQVVTLSRPEASILLKARDKAWRTHWICREVWERWRPALEERLRYSLQVLPPCRLVEDVNGYWLFAELAGKRAEPWAARNQQGPIQDLKSLFHFLERLAGALKELHSQQLIWLTFDPAEIEELAAGFLRFTNMDLAVYPVGREPERLQVAPTCAAPEVARFHVPDFGPATDVYHLALFAYFWLAGLLPKGFSGSGLEAFGHALPPLRVFNPELPPGIFPVLARGLALEPRQRYPAPAGFLSAFHKALERTERRWISAAPVSWEIGQHTRTGRSKTAAGKENEDSLLIRAYPHPERSLLAIADGISSCDVGSGGLASLITCIVLENAFDAETHQNSFPARISEVCRRSSENLLAWAIEKGYREQLASGLDLMGSTLLAGWLEGNLLTVANIGDSRAYLIDGTTVEQLTVDGDLGNELLAAGVPPEEVRSLGNMARGLRDCVGGCSVGPSGTLKILDDYCQPALARWPLLAGDVVVLCSDGLVEEGAFLEPEKMAEIVRSHLHLAPAALAEQLAQAADALHRLPSPLEPDGFGDNITCIVLKIHGPQNA